VPERDLRLALRLTADNRGFVGKLRVSAASAQRFREELEKQSESARRTRRAQERLERSTAEIARRYGIATTAVRQHRRSLLQAHSAAVRYFGIAGGGFVLHRSIAATFRAADANVELRNRLRLVTESEEELAGVRQRLIGISRETYTEIGANAALYSRLALAAETTGHSQEQLLRVTELLNQQVRLGGSDAREAAAGLVQFAQGIASGRLQGDELRSVMENLLGVQQGLVAGFAELRRRGEIDFEVTRGNIRDLASEGVLTSDLLLDAVLASADATEERFRDVNFGIAESLRLIRQELGLVLDGFEQGTGLFARFGRTLEELRNLTFGGAAAIGPGGALATNQALFDLVQAGFRDRDVVRAGRTGLAARAEQLAAGRLRGRGIGELSDEDLERIVGRGATETGAFARRSLEQAIGGFIQARFRSGFQALLDETERQFQAEARAAIRELDLRASPGGSPSRNAFLADQKADAAAERRAARERELAERRERSAREFASLQQALLTPEERVNRLYERRIELLDLFSSELDDAGASARARAAALRDADLAALAEREAQAARDAAIAEAERADAALAVSGDLARLRDENARLLAGGLEALEAIERENEERDLLLDLMSRYPAASEAQLESLAAETRLRRSLNQELANQRAYHEFFDRQTADPEEERAERRAATLRDYAGAVGGVERTLARFASGEGDRSRKLFRLRQAVALSSAIVDTASGVSRALGAYTPPTNFIFAGLVAAAGAAQIAAIRSTPEPTAFRYGGIIDRRTEFGYGGGRRGFAGEAGPEAILPLARTARGELGVRGTGGGDRIVRIDVGSIVVQAPEGTDDPQEFGRAAFEGLLHQARPVLREFLIDEQRPGGALNRTDRAA